MNILQLAKDHCANYQNAVCTGVDVRLDGTQVRFLPECSQCLLCSGQACRYLEESVLPMEKWEWKNPAEERAFHGAAHHYRMTHPDFFSAPAQRKCPDCRESALRPRQRVCEGCSKKRIKTSHAKAVRKWRGTKASDVHQLTKISP
jgi:hypothetical protein